MSITYGNIPLISPSSDIEEWIDKHVPAADVLESQRLSWPGGSAISTFFPGQLPPRPAKIGSLFWPRGASRWAVGHFLASENQLAKIRPLLYDATVSGKYKALTLALDDGVHAPLKTDLYMLPPRPLSQFGNPPDNGFYLLSLVDARYFWWEKAATVSVTSGTTTWAGLYSSLGTALGVTINASTVAAEYLEPSSDFAAQYEYLPLLLDAVAASVGHQVVRRLDGTVHAQAPATAKTVLTQNLALAGKKKSGGTFAFTTAAPTDLQALAPASVSVIFPGSGCGEGDFYKVEKTLTGLALADYGTHAGHTGTQILRSNVTANYSGGVSPENATDLDTLAAALARDWYKWRLASLDKRYAGFIAWVPEGHHDHIEWWHGSREYGLSTRIQRPEWNQLAEVSAHAPEWQQVQAAELFVDTNDYTPTLNRDGTLIIPVTSGLRYFTGVGLSTDGRRIRRIRIINGGTGVLAMTSESAASSATNRLRLPGNITVFLLANESIDLEYDCADQRYRMVSTTSCFCGTGGSGSGSPGIGSGGTDVFCAECGITCLTYSVKVTGVTNGTCTCTGVNATYSMLSTGDCEWQSGLKAASLCAAGDPGVRAKLHFRDGFWVLDFVHEGLGGVELLADYVFYGQWDCQAPLTLERHSQTGHCVWPSVLTVICGDGPDDPGCEGCATICDPLYLNLVGKGIADGTCVDCNENMNALFSLLNTGDCLWTATAGAMVCGGDGEWRGQYNRLSQMFTLVLLDANLNTVVEYESYVDWNCATSLSLSRVYDSGQCTNWPAVVALSCDAGTGCGACDTICDPLRIVTRGFTSDGTACGASCTNLNGTFDLAYVSGCLWRSSGFSLCISGQTQTVRWVLIQEDGVWVLRVCLLAGDTAAFSVLQYAVEESWDCNANLTLKYLGSSTSCFGKPATITVTCPGGGPDPDPGPDCASATSLGVPGTYGPYTTPTPSPPGIQWFKFPTTAGITYKLRVNEISGAGGGWSGVAYHSCGGSIQWTVLNGSTCHSWVSAGETVYFSMLGNLVAGFEYTIELGTGAC